MASRLAPRSYKPEKLSFTVFLLCFNRTILLLSSTWSSSNKYQPHWHSLSLLCSFPHFPHFFVSPHFSRRVFPPTLHSPSLPSLSIYKLFFPSIYLPSLSLFLCLCIFVPWTQILYHLCFPPRLFVSFILLLVLSLTFLPSGLSLHSLLLLIYCCLDSFPPSFLLSLVNSSCLPSPFPFSPIPIFLTLLFFHFTLLCFCSSLSFFIFHNCLPAPQPYLNPHFSLTFSHSILSTLFLSHSVPDTNKIFLLYSLMCTAPWRAIEQWFILVSFRRSSYLCLAAFPEYAALQGPNKQTTF